MPIDSLSSGASPWMAGAQEHRLFQALEQADWAGARAALTQGGAIPAADADGWTPVMWAARHGEQNLLDLCLPLPGAWQSINARNNDGETALMIAAQEWDAPMMKRLLELGADPNLVHPCGSTALLLFLASCPEQVDGDLIAAFVQAGVHLDAADAQGTNALMFAADKLSRDTVGYVADHMSPQRFNDVNEQGHTALFFAAQRNLEMVRLLLEKGLKADVTARDGMTSAHCAWNSGLPEVAGWLQQAVSHERAAQARHAAEQLEWFQQANADPEYEAPTGNQPMGPED